MMRSEHAVELREHAIGWRIQRLDVHIRDRTDNSGLIMGILANILRRLPNLRILTFAITGHGYYDRYKVLPDNVLQATNACRDTLQLINWYGGAMFSSKSWASFLENHPRLEAINVPVVLTQPGNSHIFLDSLKSIYVHSDISLSDMLWNINLPSINHAIYDNVYHSYHSLLKIGSKLTSIQINILRHDLDFAANRALSRIATTCKNLARLDLVIGKWMVPFFSIPESVHTMAIRIVAHQIPRRSLKTFFDMIHNILFSSPSVKTLCFKDRRNVRALRAHSQALRSNLAAILILGVNVMDHESRPLVV